MELRRGNDEVLHLCWLRIGDRANWNDLYWRCMTWRAQGKGIIFGFSTCSEPMNLKYVLALSCIALLALRVMAVAVEIFESESVKTANYGACKLEWCVSKMSQDVVVGITYIILSFRVPLCQMVLKFITTFSCTTWMNQVIMESCDDGIWHCTSCEWQIVWFAVITNDVGKANFSFSYLCKNMLRFYCRYGMFYFTCFVLCIVGSCSKMCWQLLVHIIC